MRRWNCTIVEIRATDPLISALYVVRHEVFVVETRGPGKLQIDEDDQVATHLAALSDGHVVWKAAHRAP